MKDGLGSIRTGFQRKSGGAVAAARERTDIEVVAREIGIGTDTLARWRLAVVTTAS